MQEPDCSLKTELRRGVKIVADPYLLRIIVDFDNVMVKSALLKAFWANKLFGVNIPPAFFRKRMVVDSWGLLTQKQYQMIREKVYRDIFTAYHLRPVDGSLHFVRALIEEGHFVACITSLQGFGVNIAREYFLRHKLPINCYGVGYGKSKAKRALALRADVFFDDDPHKLEKLSGLIPHLFLHDWIYNRRIKIDPDIIERVGDENTCAWERFYERIHEIENGEYDP